MSDIKEIPWDEYKKMWESMEDTRRFDPPNISPEMRNMTVQGHSGPGTPFKDEYERMMHEYHNPSMPLSIRHIHHKGITTYVPKRNK